MSPPAQWVLCSCGHAMRKSSLRTHLKFCKRELAACRVLSIALSEERWKGDGCLSPECRDTVERTRTSARAFCSPSCLHYVLSNYATEAVPELPPLVERDYAAEAARAEEARMAKFSATREVAGRMVDELPEPLMGDALVVATLNLLRTT